MGITVKIDKQCFKKTIWERALFRLGETTEEIYERNNYEEIHNFLLKFVFYSIKCNQTYSNQELNNFPSEYLTDVYETKVDILVTVSYFTYREFVDLFPINKEFNGKKNETKDYFSTMDYIEKHGGMDARITQPVKFLWAYDHWDITEYILDFVDISDELHYRKNRKYSIHDLY